MARGVEGCTPPFAIDGVLIDESCKISSVKIHPNRYLFTSADNTDCT